MENQIAGEWNTLTLYNCEMKKKVKRKHTNKWFCCEKGEKKGDDNDGNNNKFDLMNLSAGRVNNEESTP